MARPHPTKSELETWDRDHYWHAFTQMNEYVPWIVDRAEGCRLIDIDGNEYIDGVSSLWCNVLGHCHPRLNGAIRDQLDRVAHCTSLGASNTTAIQLARRLAELAPGDLRHVFFSSDGSSAVEVALKMAFQYWQQRPDPRPGKTKYVALGDAYHGDTIGSASLGGIERFHAMFGPLLFDVLRLPTPDAIHPPDDAPEPNSPQLAAYYLAQAEDLLAARHEEIAAVVIEPLVQCAAGMVLHPPGYLRGLRELTERYGVLLIADEVAVGIGRTGTLLACEQEQVVPDFVCLGKGITGGYLPLAATITSPEIYSAFLGSYAEGKTFFHGHTYGGNPLGAAVALATLDVLEEEHVLAGLPDKIARIETHLQRLAEHPHVGSVRQRGMIVGIELVRDRLTGERYDWTERRGRVACDHATAAGVWLRPLGDIVVVMPPLVVSLDELDTIFAAAAAGIDAATAD